MVKMYFSSIKKIDDKIDESHNISSPGGKKSGLPTSELYLQEFQWLRPTLYFWPCCERVAIILILPERMSIEWENISSANRST